MPFFNEAVYAAQEGAATMEVIDATVTAHGMRRTYACPPPAPALGGVDKSGVLVLDSAAQRTQNVLV